MLRKLRKRRRAGWFVVVSYLPRSQRSAAIPVSALRHKRGH